MRPFTALTLRNAHTPLLLLKVQIHAHTIPLVCSITNEVSRVLFLGLCLDFHYFSTGVVFPKFGFDFSRRAVAQALVEP